MSCLLIDTALQGLSVALNAPDGRILAQRESMEPYGQGEVLIPMIEAVLTDAGSGYENLKRLAVVKGPGAFTGLRVGLAAARMLRQVLKIPASGLCSFEALLKTYELQNGLKEGCVYIVLIETKRQDYYFRAFDGSAATVLSASEIAEQYRGQSVVIIGDAVKRFVVEAPGFDVVEILRPSAQALAALVQGGDDDLDPVYLRPADVSIPKS